MAKTFQFDSTGKDPLCSACEEMLADALDNTLSDADQAWFDRHLATCDDCSQRMADAQRGAAWLEMLKSPRPEPSAHLMERILAATSDALPSTQPVIGDVIAMPIRPARILPFRMPLPRLSTPWLEPRLAMTAAMAFFSIALTLNLTGVKLNQLKASDLSPTNLKRTYFAANAGVSRYYDNLRVVRVMESKVQDIQDLREVKTLDDPASPENKPQTPAPAPAAKPAEQPAPAPQKQDEDNQPEQQGGMTRRESPLFVPHLLLADHKLRLSGNSAAGAYPRKLEGGQA